MMPVTVPLYRVSQVLCMLILLLFWPSEPHDREEVQRYSDLLAERQDRKPQILVSALSRAKQQWSGLLRDDKMRKDSPRNTDFNKLN